MKNMSKKTKIIIVCISLLAIIGVARVIAYFTDTATVTNHVKMGIVDIELKEYTIDESGNKVEWKDAKAVLPGETLSKIPEISCVQGAADCYIRAKIEITSKDENLMNNAEMITLDNLNIDTDKWYYCEEDGYFYYKEILTDESESATLFTEVSIPGEWDNIWSLEELFIDITAESIQSKNFEPDFSEGSTNPWPGITKDDIEECIYPNHVK